jgi:hypothetical protein
MNMADDLLPPKIFESHIVLDYRTGTMRVTKKKPTKLKPFEIPIRIELTVTAPKIPDIVAKGNIQISPTKVSQMVIESL